MPVDHYENFPVASLLLPARLRSPVERIYRFARAADDIADEGDASREQRLAQLGAFRNELARIASGERSAHPLFADLQESIRSHRLPVAHFEALLDAFTQDVTQTRYRDFRELLDYCQRSANPVGRLLLHLFGVDDETSRRRSDAICTALQLINFWQDIALDWQKGRVYLPQDEMRAHRVGEGHIAEQRCDDAFRSLMAFQVARARRLMAEGAPLAPALPWRARLEIAAVAAGGLRVLDKIERVGYDVFRRRPTLAGADWLLLLWRAATA